MQKKSSAQPIIIFAVIIVLAIIAYFYFSGTPKKDPSSLLTSPDVPTSEVSNEAVKIITLLNQTKALSINTELFKSATFTSLVDHTVPVIEQPVGKANPFFYTVAPPSRTK